MAKRPKPQTVRKLEKADAFLASLLSNGGRVVAAIEAAGWDRKSAYELRNKSPEFAAAWAQAIEDSTVVLEDEITRRAVEGTLKPVFHKGVECGYIREYSDTLLMFMTKARKPDVYRERTEIKHTGEITIKSLTDEQLEAKLAALIAKVGSNG